MRFPNPEGVHALAGWGVSIKRKILYRVRVRSLARSPIFFCFKGTFFTVFPGTPKYARFRYFAAVVASPTKKEPNTNCTPCTGL